MFLITPKGYLKSFPKDAALKFAKPVPVEPMFSTTLDHLLTVREVQSGREYPVNPRNLRMRWQLTCKQRTLLQLGSAVGLNEIDE